MHRKPQQTSHLTNVKSLVVSISVRIVIVYTETVRGIKEEKERKGTEGK